MLCRIRKLPINIGDKIFKHGERRETVDKTYLEEASLHKTYLEDASLHKTYLHSILFLVTLLQHYETLI